MASYLRVDSEGIAALDATTSAQKWRLQTSATAGEVVVMGADANQPLRMSNLSNPTAQSDAATKSYVDNVASGLRIKQPVRVAVAEYTAAVGLFAGSVLDGVTLAHGDRVLLMSADSGGDAGIWVIQTSPDVPIRPADFDTGASASGAHVFVDQGTVNGNSSFVCTSDKDSDVVGATGLVWSKFSTAGAPAELTTPVNGGMTISDGGILSAGASVQLAVDATQVPFLAATNTFTASNTFSAANTFTAPNTFSDRVSFTANVPSASGDGSVIVTGGVYVSGELRCNSLLNESDERLKRDIATIENGLDVVCALRGCNYTWNDEPVNVECGRAGVPSVGVIAQETQRAGATLAVKDQGEFLAVDYTRLVPYLIEAVKSLKRTCDELSSSSGSASARGDKKARASEE